ncbi:MAG: SLBB domain-containing protein [candidate division WOR-3 bacterium]
MKPPLPIALATLLLMPVSGWTAESQPAGLSVKVAVWGQVNHPGRYTLTGTPDLVELISAAGGPTTSADLSRVVLIREQDGTRQRLNVERIATTGRPILLTTNDVVIVPVSFWSRLREGLPAVTTAAAVANVAITLLLLAGR